MSSTTAASPAGQAHRPQHLAGTLCVAAGLLGFLSGAVLALVEPAVGDERFSYPLSAGGFAALQAWFAVHHLGLLAGLVALARTDVVPREGTGRRGLRLAIAGMVGLTVTEVVAIAAADADTGSAVAGVVGALYGVDCLALGIGLVLAGAAAARSARGSGWRRWIVPALGAWVFVPMFPALVLTPTDGARWAIAGWMLLFAALGALLRGRSPSR